MSKNTQSGGSLLMRLLPSFAKTFLENASQDEVVKAEQEAAVLHQKLEAGTEGGDTPKPADEVQKPDAGASTTPLTQEAMTAMTTRATQAEAKVTDLQTRLATAETERNTYKAWYDKQLGLGTKLASTDGANRARTPEDAPELSTASANALAEFQRNRAKV